MDDGQWIRMGEVLPDQEQAAFLYLKGDGWQLYVTASGGYALAVSGVLYQKWLSRGLMEDGYFLPLQKKDPAWDGKAAGSAETTSGSAEKAAGSAETASGNGMPDREGALEKERYVLTVPAGELISSVEFGPFPQNAGQVLRFAKALKQSAQRTGEPLSDGVYLSRFGRILPGFTDQADRMTDRILGRWICGGMNISVRDTQRMQKFAPWLSEKVRIDLLQMFDLEEMKETEDVVLRMPSPLGPHGLDQSAQTQAGALEAGRRQRAEGPFVLHGREALEKFINEQILDVIDREEEYRRFGVGFPGAVLLYGPTGSGKTFAVEKLADYLGWPVFRIDSGTIGSKYVHETSRRISETFDLAIRNAPSILIIDELEAFLSSRERAGGSVEIHTEEVDEFLRRIPDAAKNKVLLFGMTNMPEALDRAVMRKGRFDHILEVGMPSGKEVYAVLESLLADLPAAEHLELYGVAARLSGLPLSDVSFVVSEAGRICVRSGKKVIDQEILEEACSVLKPAVSHRPKIGFSIVKDS